MRLSVLVFVLLCATYLDLYLKRSQAVFLQSTLQVLQKFWSLTKQMHNHFYTLAIISL